MDKVSVNEYKKGQKALITILIAFLIICALIAGITTNYKQETLICSKSKNMCYIEKINMINLKSKKEFVKFSDINNVSYMRQKIKGNRYAKGYSSYLLIFNLKDNNPIVIFSSAYLEKEELDKAIKELSLQIISDKDEIKLNRN